MKEHKDMDMYAGDPRWKVESCDPGMQNCAMVVESKHAKESHLVRYQTRPTLPTFKESICPDVS